MTATVTNGNATAEESPSDMREVLVALCADRSRVFLKTKDGSCAVGTIERVTFQNVVLYCGQRATAFPIVGVEEVRRVHEKERTP